MVGDVAPVIEKVRFALGKAICTVLGETPRESFPPGRVELGIAWVLQII